MTLVDRATGLHSNLRGKVQLTSKHSSRDSLKAGETKILSLRGIQETPTSTVKRGASLPGRKTDTTTGRGPDQKETFLKKKTTYLSTDNRQTTRQPNPTQSL